MKKSLITLSILISSLILFGQNRTYLGIETAITNDIFEFSDKGNKLKQTIVPGALWGINIRQELNNYFSIGTGIIRNYYSEGFGYNMKNFSNMGFTSNSYSSWQIPIRINYKVNLIKDRIFLTSTIGMHYCINSDYGGYGSDSSFTSFNGESISHGTTTDYGLTKTFPLLETAIGLELKLFRKVTLTISTRYCTGFKKVMLSDVSYYINSDPKMTASISGKGEYLGFGLQFIYPISDLWVKKKNK